MQGAVGDRKLRRGVVRGLSLGGQAGLGRGLVRGWCGRGGVPGRGNLVSFAFGLEVARDVTEPPGDSGAATQDSKGQQGKSLERV